MFRGEQYVAVISDAGGAISVYIPDETLHNLVPGGKFTYEPERRVHNGLESLSAEEKLKTAIVDKLDLGQPSGGTITDKRSRP